MRIQLSLLVFFVVSFGVKAQQEPSYAEAFEVFDYFVGHTNSGVFDGVEYFEKYPVRNNKHKFFDSPNFQLGSLIYNGEPYYQLALKYDVYDDVLLTRNPAVSSANITQLANDKVQQFTIGNYRFTRLDTSTDKGEELVGFFEILSENNDIILLKKHQKKMIKKIENGVYYEFKDNPWYLVVHKGSYIRIKNENGFIAIFPNSKEHIKQYAKSNSALKDEDYDSFIVSLFKELKN